MSSGVVRTEPLDRPFGRYKMVGLHHWATEFDVIPALLPFDYRSYDPIQMLIDVQELIAEAPVTNATFTVSQINDHASTVLQGHRGQLRTTLRATGLWPYGDGSHFQDGGRVERWVNPEYVHATALDPSITNTRHRIEELRRAASIGILLLSDIAPRFGVGADAVQKFCSSHDIRWRAWRDWGRCRLSRTLKTVYEWTDYTYDSLATAVGLPESTLRHWIQDAYADDFDVPVDPSGNHWFKPSNYGDQS